MTNPHGRRSAGTGVRHRACALGSGPSGRVGRGVQTLWRQATAHPCSAEALRKRVLRDGTMPSIDPVVDLYNAVSIEYAIPVGGENLTAYEGAPRLVIADGSELFDTIKEGAPAHEAPEPGEVVRRDDRGDLSPLELASGDPDPAQRGVYPDVVHSGELAFHAAGGAARGW